MALVVITLQDEDATVDCKMLFEPMVKDGEETLAQKLAGQMLGAVSNAIAVGAELELDDTEPDED